ncbi:hypothetical protein K3767_05770 [Thermosulfurimonas sp. F29]|nr:hypothetical protein [Thermosulfurimonas sp. F29]
MGYYPMKCNACIPERTEHIYLVDEDKKVLPRCNAPTVPGDLTERG